jgi:hypothetical protein
MDIEKEKDGLRVICTIIAGIGCVYGSLKNYMCFQLNNNIDLILICPSVLCLVKEVL